MVLMPRIYRKGDKLVINLPEDVVGKMELREGDIIDLVPQSEGVFTFSKRGKTTATPTDEELQVLKRLDQLRYNVRIEENVKKELSAQQAKVLAVLLKKGYVSLQKSKKDGVQRYSISDYIYDTYLYRKRRHGAVPQGQEAQRTDMAQPAAMRPEAAPRAVPKAAAPREVKADAKEMISLKNTGEYGGRLERKGYLVVSNETEASGISVALEASIRQGYVVGVRAFNKKYYIVLRSFIFSNLPRVLSLITEKAMKVDDISRETGIEGDGVRAILYVASENGDVT